MESFNLNEIFNMVHLLLILIQTNPFWNLKLFWACLIKLFLIASKFFGECFYGPQFLYEVQNASVGVRSATRIFLRGDGEGGLELELKLKIF